MGSDADEDLEVELAELLGVVAGVLFRSWQAVDGLSSRSHKGKLTREERLVAISEIEEAGKRMSAEASRAFETAMARDGLRPDGTPIDPGSVQGGE